MEAIHTTPAQPFGFKLKTTTPVWLVEFDKFAEFNRYAIITIGFLLVGTVGGLTVGFYGYDATWKIALIAGFTMLSLTLMLAVAPIKIITRALAVTLLVDLFVVLMAFV